MNRLCLGMVIFAGVIVGIFLGSWLTAPPTLSAAPGQAQHIALPSPPSFSVTRKRPTTTSTTSTNRPYVIRSIGPDGRETVTITNRGTSTVEPSIYPTKLSSPSIRLDDLSVPPIEKVPTRWVQPTTIINEQNVSRLGTGEAATIVIDRSDCWLYVYNREDQLLFGAPVALGKHNPVNETPLGHYLVTELYRDPVHRPSARMAADGGLPSGEIPPWRSFAVTTRAEGNPNGLGAAWIGLAGNGTSGLGIHGTNDPASIRTYASDGCVRLRNGDVLRLVGLCRPGTVVDVVAQLEKGR